MITLCWTDLVLGAAVAGGVGAVLGAVGLVVFAIAMDARSRR